jgi:2-hydroxycyclohexanecarboxyl-CoA dehydrogenase
MTAPRKGLAVVTGGARGIGLAISHRFAADGFRVVILDKDGVAAKDAAEGLPPGAGASFPCDVTDVDEVSRVATQIGAEEGPCRVLVSNVGWTPNKPFVELDAAERTAIVEVNYMGALNVCAAFLGQLSASGAGRIVLVGSDAARIGTPKESVYAGAKAALIGFGKSLAVEVARDGVTVNVVSPGSTETPLIRQMLTDEQIAKRVRANPMRRMARPEDVAAAVAYFARDDAAYVTGQVLSVNGGMTRVD